MINRKILFVVALIIILATFVLLVVISEPPLNRLEKYRDSFGFSVGAAKAEIINEYDNGAHHDYVELMMVRASGNLSGTVFDTDLMSEGLSDDVKEIIRLTDIDKLTERKYSIKIKNAQDRYKYRPYKNKAEFSSDMLYVIYDSEEKIYFFIKK